MAENHDVDMHDADFDPEDGDHEVEGDADMKDQDDSTTMPATQYTQFVAHHIPTEEELDEKYPNRPKNTKPTLPFHELYLSLFEPLMHNKKRVTGVGGRGLRQLKPHEVRRHVIERFIGKWRREVGPDIYPAFRLIMPDKDRDRTVYGLKEKIIGKMFVKIMKINRDSEDGQALINWKLPGVRSTGDFAGRCYEIIRKRPMRTTPGDLTIADVNDMLDKLCSARKEEQQLPIMTEFYNNMNAEELMWVVRIILKQMKVGATEKTFFQAWHEDAENLFNVSSQLKRVCWELSDPNLRLDSEESTVTLMSCFQPQLAQFQKKSIEGVVRGMRPEGEDNAFWIEEKLDGERMQLHMQDGQFKFWSRKAKDYTYLYGSTFKDGAITRYITEGFNSGVRNIILDGEMVTWDPVLDVIVAFGTLKTAAIAQNKNHFDENCHRPLFRVFDILYLNGESLTNYTLLDRRRALEKSFKSIHRRVEIHPYTEATTAIEIETQLRQVIAEASEGLVIKNPRSMYRLNDRNDDWMKVKPEYMTEFGEELDCLIIGGYYGSGRRGGFLSSFLCGLRVDGNHLKPGDSPMKFWSFCKVGGGMCASDYTKIQHITAGYWKTWDPKKPPTHIIELAGDSLQYERPDEWIPPDKSLVIAIKAASTAASDQFRVGKTLRFPRFKSFKEERDWRSALSITEFNELKAKVDQERDAKMDVERRTKRASIKRKREVAVIGMENAAKERGDGAGVKKPYGGPSTMLFEGFKFYIMTESLGPEKKSKAELEQLVKANGAKFFQTENADPDIKVIGDRNTVKVTALKKKGTVDIIRPTWIFDNLKQHQIEHDAGRLTNFVLPLEPGHLFHATTPTATTASNAVDPHNDSYCRDISDVSELTALLSAMPTDEFDLSLAHSIRKNLFLDPQEEEGGGADLEYELPGFLFHNFVVYIDTPEFAMQNNLIPPPALQLNPPSTPSAKARPTPSPSLILTATTTLLLFGSATISKKFHEEAITHIVVDTDSTENDSEVMERVRRMREVIKWRTKTPRIVSTAWVTESLKARTVLDEERFAVWRV